jgi:hypothetical protein
MITIGAITGIAAGLLDCVTSYVYIRSILKGETKPDRVTWWVLGVVSTITAASYYASGARETIWLPIAYALSFLVIAVLSLRYGDGSPRVTILQRVSLLGALLSGLTWWLASSPAAALTMAMMTEAFGFAPTINKSFRRPWTESTSAWALGTTAAFLNVLAIQEWRLVVSAYPIAMFLLDVLIMYFLLRKRST